MLPDSIPVHLDPDFRSSIRADSFRPAIDGSRYRRMVFNGYPAALLAIVFVTIVVRFDMDDPMVYAFLFPPVALALLTIAYYLPRSLRFYCLDCGAGGRLSGWRGHVCPDVARRIAAAAPARFRLPGVAVQLFVQTLVLGLLFAAVVAITR